MNKISIGVAGLHRGARAAEIAAAYSDKVKIAAVCDLDRELAENTARELNCANAYDAYEKMLAEPSLDAVYIATPIPVHADHAVMALEAGKHVLSEVTCLTDLRDCARLVRAVEQSGKQYMLAENYNYLRSWRTVMNMAADGLFGEIYYAEGDYVMNFHVRSGFPYIGGWRQNIYHMHRGHVYITHSLGPLAEAFGFEPVRRVSCEGSGSYPRGWGLRADNSSVLLLKTESEKLIRLRLDFLSRRPDNFLYYGIQGTKGAYEGGRSYPGSWHEGDRREVQNSSQKVCLEGYGSSSEWRDLEEFTEYIPQESAWLAPEDIRRYGVYNEGVGVMFNEFAEAVLSGKAPRISLSRSLNWTAAGLLSERSVDSGGLPVAVPVFCDHER